MYPTINKISTGIKPPPDLCMYILPSVLTYLLQFIRYSPFSSNVDTEEEGLSCLFQTRKQSLLLCSCFNFSHQKKNDSHTLSFHFIFLCDDLDERKRREVSAAYVERKRSLLLTIIWNHAFFE